MSFWDNVKKFAQPYADDDYDDYDDEDEYMDDYDDEPAEPVRRAPARRNAPAPAPVDDEEDDDDFSFNAAPSAPAVSSSSAVSTASGFNGRVLNTSGPKQEVVLFRPISFNDTSRAADSLRHNKAVVLNLEGVDKDMARRVVDFLSGTIYAVDGSVKKVAQYAYLFCPHNMDVVGDLETLQAEVESYI